MGCPQIGFWSDIANGYHWEQTWNKTDGFKSNFSRSQGAIDIKWFAGGKTNICFNCLDRHVIAGNGDKVAYIWYVHIWLHMLFVSAYLLRVLMLVWTARQTNPGMSRRGHTRSCLSK